MMATARTFEASVCLNDITLRYVAEGCHLQEYVLEQTLLSSLRDCIALYCGPSCLLRLDTNILLSTLFPDILCVGYLVLSK